MEEEKNETQAQEPEKPPFIPASKSQRVAAWIGIIMMVLLVILYSYSLATGAFLQW